MLYLIIANINSTYIGGPVNSTRFYDTWAVWQEDFYALYVDTDNPGLREIERLLPSNWTTIFKDNI